MIYFIFPMTLLLALVLRILPRSRFLSSLGADHWFWKSYIETYRRERRFPPTLPQYLLDEQQWYPPLFPIFLRFMPKTIFDKYSHAVAVGIDIIRLLLLLVIIYWLSGGNIYALIAGGLVYATTPILISYNIQLNPRGLAAFFLDVFVFVLALLHNNKSPVWLWAIAILLSGLILLTHKMTTQLFWFLCFTGGILIWDWRLLAMIPLSILTALLLSKGFYAKVLRAHFDIVSFWHRNWRWLQANPIKESPIYGDPEYETPRKFHRKGLTGVFRHIVYLCAYNPAAWILLLYSFFIPHENVFQIRFIGWYMGYAGLTLLFAFLTVFVNPFKCLGSGYFYIYNISLSIGILWSLTLLKNAGGILGWLLFMVSVGLNLWAILIFYKNLYINRAHKTDLHLEPVFDYLRNAPKGPVLCLPPQLYDIVAYKTGQPVLYGGHGYGFKLLEPLFPRFKIPLKEIIGKYGVRYILASEEYLTERFKADIPFDKVEIFAPYRIYQVH